MAFKVFVFRVLPIPKFESNLGYVTKSVKVRFIKECHFV